ncbi:hypothetical protein AUP74_00683 [Microbulbifer aggregans]|uniref:Wadjet protein JetD C-terminal domain-containing protein n=1 Tax=Microbulbifer aggregans TaxID=1769779 RepID=A0A1C9W4T6_9GAMM|nr:hypothetical protein [Microbulbifer aggregans]AOS96152.1 hypothetical protein AUP74_00683 [Microbulbifer aggregans]
MPKPHEYFSAIRDGAPINWRRFLTAMGRNGVLPGHLMQCLQPESRFAGESVIKVLDERSLREIESQFPAPAPIIDRISASHSGKSHSERVEGNALMIQHISWDRPRVAFSRDGQTWIEDEPAGDILVIVENLQNFIRFEETIALVVDRCGLSAAPSEITLLFGAGQAAAKACNRTLYTRYREVHTLLDLDAGGIKIYGSIKALLANTGLQPRFLVPDNIDAYLARATSSMSQDERTAIHCAGRAHPELTYLLQRLYLTGKKLEQETYLDPLNE